VVIRIVAVAALLAFGIFALRHPVPHAAIVAQTASGAKMDSGVDAFSNASERRHDSRRHSASESVVVYVAGAVVRPGLYRLTSGERAARAVALAGGMASKADAAGVNLAQRAQDGDEIYVPALGEKHSGTHRRSRHSSSPPPEGSVDINSADARELARVPGIGRSVAARIVELRYREGSFASLDELLDVAGMTQSRLERARPYLRQP
jgi:competence protein ComEA